jgi:WD40 repeat protein
LPVEDCLELGLTLNLALGHLHRAALIHRDIKPSNIIYVHGVAKLADIGLVVAIPEAHSLVGTIGFIAPEGPNSPQSDLYSLGKVLYEAGMGKDRQDFPEPFTNLDQASDAAMLLELNAIILKACASNPSARYGSAEEMNADLALVKSGQSVRRKRTLERRIVKFKRTTVAAASVALLIGAGYFWQSHQTRQLKKLASENFQLATAGQRAAQEMQHRLNERDVAKGQQLLEQDDSYRALLWFANGFDKVGHDPVLEEAHRLRIGSLLRSVPKICQIFTHDEGVVDFKFGNDGTRLVSASKDHTARVWDIRTGKAITPPLEHEAMVQSCDLSPDGKWVATASGSNAYVWDGTTGRKVTTFRQHANWVQTVRFDPNGKRLLTASSDHTARLWDALSGRELLSPLRHTNDVRLAEFSPNGKIIATASGQFAQIWDAATGQKLTAPLFHDLPVWCLQFSPDGHRLATGQGGNPDLSWTASYKAAGILWDTITGQRVIGPMWHDGSIKKIVFSPDGRYCATGGWKDSTAKIWDTITGDPLGMPINAGQEIWDVQFSPDGRRILTSSANGTARVWDIFTGKPLTPALRHTGWVVRSAFSPDGRYVATGSDDHTIKLWDLVSGAGDDVVVNHPGYLSWLPSTCFSPGGKQILTVCFDGMARLWDAQNGKLLLSMRHGKHAGFGCFSPDGKMILTASGTEIEYGDDGADYLIHARIWDAGTGKERVSPVTHEPMIYSASFSLDSKRFATVGGSRARVWDTSSGTAVSPWLVHSNDVVSTDFSPDGKTILTASDDRTAQMWDAATGERKGNTMNHPAPVVVASFSPDGKKILTINLDQTGRVWDARTGDPISPWLKHNGTLSLGAWSPDSTRVMTGGLADCAKVWDATTGNLALPWLVHGASLVEVGFSRHGHLIMTAGNGSVRIWNSVTGELLVHRTWHDDMTSARLSPDGLRILTAWWDGQARIWNLAKSDLAPKEMLMLAELLSGEELDEHGGPVSLTSVQVAERWHLLKSQHPELFTSSQDQVRKWFLTRLKESLAYQHFSSANFFLQRLLHETPNDESLKSFGTEIEQSQFPPRDQTLSPKLLDLTAYYNAPLHQPPQAPQDRLDFSELSLGGQKLAGTDFDVRGMIRVNQLDRMTSGRLWPQSVSGIKVNQRCQRLQFLHGALKLGTFGAFRVNLKESKLGAYIIHYIDGQQREIPLHYGQEIEDCLTESEIKPPTAAVIGWQGSSPTARRFNLSQRLDKLTWENPMPDIEIKSIDFISSPALVQPFLIAITAE